jgi:amino acid adenylation domain-containing protein
MTPLEKNNLASIVIRTAIRYPENLALKLDDESVTYREFDRRIRSAQAYLREHAGARKGANLAVVSFKSIDALVLAQAALRLGWNYTVVDPRYPKDRIKSILEDCKPAVVLSDLTQIDLIDTLPIESECVLLTQTCIGRVTAKQHPIAEALSYAPVTEGQCEDVAPEDVAFVFYTSGTTDVPKGVPVTHANVWFSICWAHAEFAFSSDEVFLNQAHMGFDFCILDYYNAWNAGAAVILVPEYAAVFSTSVVEIIKEERVTNLWLVPSNIVSLIEHGRLLDVDATGIRRFLYAGEPFAIKYLKKIYDWMKGRNVYNLYGPTETNLLTYYKVTAGDLVLADVPIGAPLPNTALGVLDEQDRLQLHGKGELVAHSPSVFPGYSNRADLNAMKFIQANGKRWYRTGDICDIDPDGRIWYKGRTDSMVKIRGYRVELQEIELAFARLPEVLQAVAVVRRNCDDNGNEVYLFCTVSSDCDEHDLKQRGAAQLPAYMTPARVKIVNDIPFNDQGKADKASLLKDLAC